MIAGEEKTKGEEGMRDERQVQSLTIHSTIPDKIRLDYTYSSGNPTRRALEGVQNLLSHSRSPHADMDKLLNEAKEFIRRQFEIDTVSIGLRDLDGLYRYKATAGLREEAVEALKKIVYRKEQFFDNAEFHGVQISKYSRIYLQEDNPLSEKEQKLYARPGLLGIERRKDETSSLEGDYIDTGIYDAEDELIGWIEFSGTRTMKLPDATTIRWIELVASIVAVALMRHGQSSNARKKGA